MKKETYDKLMGYLDLIEVELNKAAEAIGHPSYDEFFYTEEKQEMLEAA